MRMRAFLAALLLSATPALAQTTVVGTGGMQTTGANATAAALQALATNAGSASLGLNDGDANSQFGIKYNGTSVYPFGVLNTHGDYIFNFDPSGYVKTEANSEDGYTQGPPYVVYFNNLSPANGDTLGHYAYLGNDSAHNYQTFSYISSLATDVTDTALSSRLQFGVMNAVNGSSGPSHQPNLFMTWDATNGLALSGMPITGAGPITATSAGVSPAVTVASSGSNAAILEMNDTAGGQQALTNYDDGGVLKYQYGMQSGASWIGYDVANSLVFEAITTGGNMSVGETGKTLTLNGSASLGATTITGSLTATGLVTNADLAGSITAANLVAAAHSQTNVAGPITQTTVKMAGLAGSITPTYTGTVMLVISGDIANATAIADGGQVQASYGTGTAPTSASAVTGTQCGGLQKFVTATVAEKAPFSVNCLITGLSLSTAYWLDLTLAQITGGTASISDISISAIEIR